jgi:hypothetical protein
MSESTNPAIRFESLAGLPLEAAFDAGRLTSDGGLPWLAEADEALGLWAGLAAEVPEWRRGPVRHSLVTLVRQRVYQIACGYEDQDDADTLRADPLRKLACGRLPESGADLASQPTLSRLENAADRGACYRLARALVAVYLRERERDGVPEQILLDLDGTDAPTHGDQEGTACHGYYRQHMYHPLLVFDGDTDQLVAAVLRPGNAHGSRGVVAILKRLVAAVRSRWPGVRIELRADSGFAVPALYDFCEAARITYTIGLAPERPPGGAGRPAAGRGTAPARRDRRQGPPGRRGRVPGQDLATPPTRRLQGRGAREGPQHPLRRHHAHRRPARRLRPLRRPRPPEQWVGDFKLACFADRLSCHAFWANQFRLLLHAAAYWLLDTLRRWLTRLGVPRLQLDTLRLRLLKIGGRVRQLATRARLSLASHHPGEPLWRLLATARLLPGE